MTVFDHFVHTAWARAVGWTLFHSLWEGALAALVLLAVLVITRSPRVRYACACGAMLGVVAAFAITLCALAPRGNGAPPAIRQAVARAPIAANEFRSELPARFHIDDALPWLAPFWIAGVLVFHLRSLAGWMAAQRLRDRGVCRAGDQWTQRLEHLQARLRVSRPVALLETCLVDAPVVLGYLRPVILTPAGMLAGMPATHVEAILLHELAHIRRGDYLMNLLQTVVEGFLFYHPAMWWISGVIRSERENCCDDVVVAASGNARQYAAALAALEQTRWAADQAAMAATGGSLAKRIRRLLYVPKGRASTPLLSAAILTMVLAGGLVAWQATALAQNQQPPTTESASPYARWLDEDVVYIITPRERAAFESLRTDEERDRFIEQFWLRRDPTPGTPENEFRDEHYRRIAFANNHFAWRSVPGWKTDRGRIYILFGPPDELEIHPSGQPAVDGAPARNYPFADWLYHVIKDVGKNVAIEFADTAKDGDFRMVENATAPIVAHP